MSKTDFKAPTTFEEAMNMVAPLDPDKDWSTKDKYVAFERLKMFFKLILPSAP